MPPWILIACAKNYDEELKAELALRHSRPSLLGPCVRWLPPQGGSFKLNVDGAIDLKVWSHRSWVYCSRFVCSFGWCRGYEGS